MKKEIKTPQQILQEAREEIRSILLRNFDNDKYLWSKADKEMRDLLDRTHTSTLHSFIEAEIAREEGMKIYRANGVEIDTEVAYNQAKDETISHLKELLETKI